MTDKYTAELGTLETNIEKYKKHIKRPNNRLRSWDHCYLAFKRAIVEKEGKISATEVDNLALHLGFFLASWGMYRGSSFLLQKDYEIHKKIVQELIKREYCELFGISIQDLMETRHQDNLIQLISALKDLYQMQREKGAPETRDLLVSKVLLGTMGCFPALDRFVVTAMRKRKITVSRLINKKNEAGRAKHGVVQMIEAFKDLYEAELKDNVSRNAGYSEQVVYPDMKLLDMHLWMEGGGEAYLEEQK